MNMTVHMIEELAYRARLSLSKEEKLVLTDDLTSLSELLSVLDAWEEGEMAEEDACTVTLSDLRADAVAESLPRSVALEQAGRTQNGFFTVPATVEVQG